MVTQMLRVDAENLEGLKAVVPLHYGRSGGIGARAEMATLPSAGAQSYNRATYDLAYHYAIVQVSGPAIAKTKSEAGSFLQALKAELDFIRNDLQLDQARQFYGAGDGKIASVSSVAGAVVTLTSAEPIYHGYLYVGAVVDVGEAATPTAGCASAQIVDYDLSTPSVTLDADHSGTITNAMFFYRAGNNVGGTVAEVNAGLQALIGTGAVGNINPATAGQSYWQSTITSFAAAPALADLIQVQNQLINWGAKGTDLTVTTTPGLVRRLFAASDFQTAVRFVNSTTLTGGFEQLSFVAGNGPVKLNSDRLHPWGQFMFVDKQRVRVFSPADWDFLSRDGLTVRWVPNVDAFQAILFRYLNLGTDRRNTSARITGYTDVGY